MMNIKEIELDFKKGQVCWKSAKGTFVKNKIFSYSTDNIIFWAEYELDYCGG